MKPTEEIIDKINLTINQMVAKPSMFASSPESLEEQFQALLSLKLFIVGDEESRLATEQAKLLNKKNLFSNSPISHQLDAACYSDVISFYVELRNILGV